MLKGRKIIVTGTSGGLGQAFAKACKDNGASLILADIVSERSLELVEEFRKDGTDAHFIQLDLSSPENIKEFAAKVKEIWGYVDGLANNAAIATGIGGKTFEEIDIETWDKVMTVNVRGTWLMIRNIAPLLRLSPNGGRIVNLASDTALWGAPRLLSYVASKGAIISMTRSLARELGTDSITVNAIAPGIVKVPATDYVPQERKDLYVNNAAIQRTQTPDDQVGAMVFLLSEPARFITGQVLPVNGGFVMK